VQSRFNGTAQTSPILANRGVIPAYSHDNGGGMGPLEYLELQLSAVELAAGQPDCLGELDTAVSSLRIADDIGCHGTGARKRR
jgi:hypothetical protein